MEAKLKGNINIRPPKSDAGSIEKLELLAKEDGRTLNNYIWRVLSAHIKRNKNKIK